MAFEYQAMVMIFFCSGIIFAAPATRQPNGKMARAEILNVSTPRGPRISGIFPNSQKTIPDSKTALTVAGFQFRIVKIAFATSAMGFVPKDMASSERLMFVEFELLSGKREDFKSLQILVSHASVKKLKAVAVANGGMMKMLSPMTMKKASSDYRPEDTKIAWAYVVPKNKEDFLLHFPTGEVISLAPLIREK